MSFIGNALGTNAGSQFSPTSQGFAQLPQADYTSALAGQWTPDGSRGAFGMPGGSRSGGAIGQAGRNVDQDAYIQALQQQMAGKGPSVAENLLRQQTQANNMSAAGAIGGARGINPALQARMILDQQAQNNQMMAGQGSLARSQEQLGAAGMLGGAINNRRAQDLGYLGTLGGFQQGQNALNLQNVMGTNQINAGLAGQTASSNAGLWGGLISGAASAAAKVSTGGMSPKAKGGLISGDHVSNDIVPAMLSPGEIVLPRSVAQSEDAPEKAKAFVRAIQRKHKMFAGGLIPHYGRGGPQLKVPPTVKNVTRRFGEIGK